MNVWCSLANCVKQVGRTSGAHTKRWTELKSPTNPYTDRLQCIWQSQIRDNSTKLRSDLGTATKFSRIQFSLETSVRNYHNLLRNNSEERGFLLKEALTDIRQQRQYREQNPLNGILPQDWITDRHAFEEKAQIYCSHQPPTTWAITFMVSDFVTTSRVLKRTHSAVRQWKCGCSTQHEFRETPVRRFKGLLRDVSAFIPAELYLLSFAQSTVKSSETME